MIKKFISLVKPGIIFGNLLTVAAGFFLASTHHVSTDYWLFVMTCLGVSLVIASGCVFNNCIDRDIDKLMQRTCHRVLARNEFSITIALIYAVLLGIFGSYILYTETNELTLLVALFGLFIYVVIYSLWLKRNSVYGTIIGSISGSIPPVAGYCAVTNRLDFGALILFLILSFWQMPHSYAIAIYRLNDYKAAHIPVLPICQGIGVTKIHMLCYIGAFTLITTLLTLLGYTGYIVLSVALLLGVSWFILGVYGLYVENETIWARKMFLLSIVVITLLSITIVIRS